MAAGEGFEPSQTESESGVLPLHNPAKRKSYYTYFSGFVKKKLLVPQNLEIQAFYAVSVAKYAAASPR